MDRTRWPGRWYRIAVTLPADQEDEVQGLLQVAGSLGAASAPAGPQRIELTAWFEDETAATTALARLALRPGVRAGAGEAVPVEDTGWLEGALRPREPIRAGRFVVVLDASETADAEVEVRIPLGRAFGTGEHETTRMCLALLDRHLRPQDRVLDLGTGSGILGIAAARAGSGPVRALDNDPAVLDVVQENVVLNGVEGRVAVGEGSWGALDPGDGFELILANIHRSALERGAAALASRLAPGGRAILSGFVAEDAERVLAAWVEQGLALLERIGDGEWAALAVGKQVGG